MNAARRLCLALCIGVVGAMFAAPAAMADYLGYVDSFDGSDSTPTPGLIKPTTLAVNNQTGDLLVLDEGPNEGHVGYVKQFDADGDAKPFAGLGGSNTIGPFALGFAEFTPRSTDIAVDSTTTASSGNIYVVSHSPGFVYGYHADGTPLGGNWPLKFEIEYGGPSGVWVDQNGKIWIQAGGIVQYTAAGVPTGVKKNSSGGTRIGFDTTGKLYENLGPQYRVTPASELTLYALGDAPEPGDVSIDPATNDAYLVSAGTEVVHFDEKGLTKARFGAEDPDRKFGGLINSEGVAFSAVNGNIYASDFGTSPAKIDIFNYVPPKPPEVADTEIREVRSAGARVEGLVTARGGATSYKVEYGPTTSYGTTVSGVTTVGGFKPARVQIPIAGLIPGTTYHYRLVATNSTASTPGPDRTFTTYPYPKGGVDPCPNALARQQAGTSGLLDCRAYEQVSALSTGGYDVESNQIPNGAPLAGFPAATNPPRVVYTTSSGSIPDTDNPTGHVGDPYVATRTEAGWTSRYVGIPANGPAQTESFSSPLVGADSSLSAFAFGGAGLCKVCLPDGSRGIPIRDASGQLVQGMAGSLSPAGAEPAGYIGKHFSDDGSHFLFGSTAQFEPDGAGNGTDVSIYARSLETGVTRVVSKTPGGATMTGSGNAALDINTDGSRVLIAQRVSTDSKGNDYWHLYMNVGGSSQTIDVSPGASSGVLYDGMTSNGSQVFFSSVDPLTPDDTDSSSDIYRADVSTSTATLTRISTGGGNGDTDACDPVSDYSHARWNSLDAAASCDAVAIAGGGGLGVGDGSFYFLSPELLDGASNGVLDAPNLYVTRPGGSPAFVSTLESSNDSAPDPELRRTISSFFSVGKRVVGIAVDPDNGDFYVMKAETAEYGDVIEKYDSSGTPSNWSFSAPYIVGNKLIKAGPVNGLGFGGSGQLAVDNSGGPTDGYIYVTGSTAIFDETGEYLGAIEAGGCGVAVDPLGRIFTVNYYQNRRYTPVDGNPQNNTFKEMGNIGFPFAQYPCWEATDSTGAIYISNPGVFVKRFPAAQFDSKTPKGIIYEGAVTALAVDQSTNELFLDEGTQVSQWSTSGEKRVSGIGAGILKDSRGIWVDDGQTYVADYVTGVIYKMTPVEAVPEPVESNPLVVNAVDSPGKRRTGDFQVATQGGAAVFPSNLSLTGEPTDRHVQIYRFDPGNNGVLCISCTPTGGVAESDANLAPNGRSMTDDGKVFFTTGEPLTLRDAGARRDVYEWTNNQIELISTGSSPFDATLLSTSADGKDVYFFSREDLLSTGNGQAMKIFDARSGGGRFVLPPAFPCAASDECHGPGTAVAPPQGISTLGGKGGQHKKAPALRCKKGKVKKHGKCVRKTKKQSKKKHTSTRRHG